MIHSDQGREFENGLMYLAWMCQDTDGTLSPGIGWDGGEV